nr:unnamed protein product [Spirometra erinaceieuropaei]
MDFLCAQGDKNHLINGIQEALAPDSGQSVRAKISIGNKSRAEIHAAQATNWQTTAKGQSMHRKEVNLTGQQIHLFV